jgi:2,3-bisphosphoglycerate-independent phosphoglycerate mutase
LERIAPSWLSKGGIFILTADHGNCDEMYFEENGKEIVSTQHSLNKVPLWVIGKNVQLRPEGIIPDIGVTVLDLMGLEKPTDMTAASLISK